MNFYDLSWQLADLLESSDSVFLKTEPEVLDFTDSNAQGKIVILTQRGRVDFEVTPKSIQSIMGLMDQTIFNPERVDRLYVWNFKSLVSYARFYNAKFVIPQNSIIDLKPIEGFLGLRKKPPENFHEVVNRTKAVVRLGGWQRVYKSIHQPLFLTVLPAIENTALLNEHSRRPEHPYYEIEGQINGRMNCAKRFVKCYLPHNMGPDQRRVLKPRGYDLRFVTADFRHCEVNVLQWLSKDEALGQIIESGEDVHKRIYEIVTGDSCDTENKRKISKVMYLPVMYGCGPKGLANNLGLAESVGEELFNRIRSKFSTSMQWMMDHQERAKTEIIRDHFGRPRHFKPEESYLVRNFIVQAVAATVCQEKLIELHKALDSARIAFSVHDGFGMITEVRKAKKTYDILKGVMESESRLCPGLRMKIEVKFGTRLDNLKVLWKD